MKTVSGSFHTDWWNLDPGDLVIPIAQFVATWPPDGHRRWSGKGMTPRLQSRRIEPGCPFIVVATIHRELKTATAWSRGTWALILNDGLWWHGTSVTGSLG